MTIKDVFDKVKFQDKIAYLSFVEWFYGEKLRFFEKIAIFHMITDQDVATSKAIMQYQKQLKDNQTSI